jgi:hypothetical protein
LAAVFVAICRRLSFCHLGTVLAEKSRLSAVFVIATAAAGGWWLAANGWWLEASDLVAGGDWRLMAVAFTGQTLLIHGAEWQ